MAGLQTKFVFWGIVFGNNKNNLAGQQTKIWFWGTCVLEIIKMSDGTYGFN